MVYQRETLLWIIDELAYLASHFYTCSGCLILRDSLISEKNQISKRAQLSEHYFLNETLQQSLVHPLGAVWKCPVLILISNSQNISLFMIWVERELREVVKSSGWRRRQDNRREDGKNVGTRGWRVEDLSPWCLWCDYTEQDNESSLGEPDYCDSELSLSSSVYVWHRTFIQKHKPSG